MNAWVQFIWLRVPIRVGRRWRSAGMVFADGHYLVRWKPVAGLALPICALIGLAAGALHEHPTYTYSLILMILLGLIGQFGASLGLCITLGFAVGDFFLNDAASDLFVTSTTPQALTIWLPALLSYFLLGLLTVMCPVSVLGFRTFVLGLPSSIARLVEPLVAAGAAALGAWVWAQSIPLLIRPVFVWPGGVPDTDAIAPLQEHGAWLVIVLAIGAMGRVFLERAALDGRVTWLSMVLSAGLKEADTSSPQSKNRWVVAAVGAIGTTFLLSGLIQSYWTALAVCAFFAGLLLLRVFLISRLPRPVAVLIRVPLPIRIGIGAVCAYFVSETIVSLFWAQTQTFFPVLAGVCAAVAIVTLATLPRPPTAATGGAAHTEARE